MEVTMRRDQWMVFFRDHAPRKRIFSIADIRVLTGRRKGLEVELHRLVSSGLVTRVARGWYGNPYSPPSIEEIAMVLRSPSYISMEYALGHHGILSQIPFTITLVSTLPIYTFTTDRTTFEYHQISPALYMGYVTDDRGISIASPEKALLDLIHIRLGRGHTQESLASLTGDMHMDLLDLESLATLTPHFGPRTRDVVAIHFPDLLTPSTK